MTYHQHPRVRCRHMRPFDRLCTEHATTATALSGRPRCLKHAEPDQLPEGTPVIVSRHAHWVRLEWPDGTRRTTNQATAAKLGAVEPRPA